MRFSFAESMIEPGQYSTLAVEAEQAGFHSFTIPDSICYPEHSDASYPYYGDGDRSFLEDKPFIEPFVLAAALAAVTERLRFTTFVVKLPVRQPVLVAKQVASVDALSGGRFGFGVGLSPWPEDFQVTGTEWKARGRRMDEMIEIIRGLLAGGYHEFHGEFYDLPRIKIDPVPERPVPVLIGGHSDAALRRAARLGDGWMHAGGDPAELDRHLARLAELRKEHGREKEPFEIHVISLDGFTVDGAKRLEEKGVTDCIVGFRNAYEKDVMPLQQKVDALRAFGDNVIARL
jgi:probable F420-dependent oxidoreductase